jgi:hypothetical protein
MLNTRNAFRASIGFAEMDSSDPRNPLTRPIREGRWFVREVEDRLYDDQAGRKCVRLVLVNYRAGRARLRGPPNQRTRGDHGVLDAFVGLADASDTKVLAFARRYSALELCEHGAPWIWHTSPEKPCARLEFQPTALYRRYAATASELLRVASLLHRGKTPKTGDYAAFEWLGDYAAFKKRLGDYAAFEWPADSATLAKEAAIERVEWELSRWLDWGDVSPRLDWDSSGAHLQLRGNGLWGALARQLTFAVARVERWAFCHGCGGFYVPSRKPREGEQNWCEKPECKHESKRHAGRAYKRRQRS